MLRGMGLRMAVLHGHEFGMSRSKRALSLILNGFAEVAAVSAFARDNAKRWLKKDDITVIPNGVALSALPYHPRETPRFEVLQLLTVGTVSPRKGQHNVVKSMPAVLRRFPGLTYLIAGQLRDPALVNDAVKRFALEGKVYFYGLVSEARKQELLGMAGIFVMLSENLPNGDVEGFGIAVLEANQVGLPAIGSKGCGIEQAISDRFSGRLVDPHEPEAFLAAIEDIMDNYQNYSRNAIDWAGRHSWDIIGKQYAERLEKLMLDSK
jgi:glycosyltransferase involved in cell wall biosynthesis